MVLFQVGVWGGGVVLKQRQSDTCMSGSPAAIPGVPLGGVSCPLEQPSPAVSFHPFLISFLYPLT